MGVIRDAIRLKSNTTGPGLKLDETLTEYVVNNSASAARVVTEQTSMRLAAVYACVQLLTKTLAMTPLVLYRRVNNGKERATDHPLYNVLRYAANSVMPSFQLKECMMLGNVLSGNGYAYIVRNMRGQTAELRYIPHNQCEPVVEKDRLIYKVTVNGKQQNYQAEDILHIPGLGYNGIKGFSPIEVARGVIGKGLATQEFGDSFFRNGAKPSGAFEHPAKLSDEAFDRLRQSIDSEHGGVQNSNKTLILEEGMKYSPITISPEQAQFLETMKFNVSDIARIYGVPPHMVGDLDRATFSNIEHQSIEFVMYTMLPWFSRWEQYVNFKCLSAKDREDGYFSEFMLEYLLKGDSEARAKMYHMMRQDGVINADEWRAKENMNEIPGGLGQHYFINGNMVSVDNAAKQQVKGG